MEKHKNRIFGVIILFIISFFFYAVDVNARGECPNKIECKFNGNQNKYCYDSYSKANAHHYAKKVRNFCKKKVDVRNYYDFDFDKVSEGKYEVSISPGGQGANDKWEIVAVNGNTAADGVGTKVKKGSPATFEAAPINDNVTVKLKLVESYGKYRVCIGNKNAATGSILSCDKSNHMDQSGTLTVTQSIKDVGEPVQGVVKTREKEMDEAIEKAKAMTSESYGNKQTAYESFEHWNDSKAEDGGHEKPKYISPNKVNTDLDADANGNAKELKCNVSDKSYYRKDGKYNYTNKHYFYTEGEKDLDSSENNKRKLNGKQVCTTKCTEQIKVEYGPPAVSIGGFCFQYQVQITSYVKCKTEIDESTRPEAKTWCLPAPINKKHLNDQYRNQAGPNEKYEACIKDCDGGKYSQKCSKKCYKEVYGDNSSKEKLSLLYKNNNYNNIVGKNNSIKATKTGAFNRCTNSNGKYKWSGDNIVWDGTGVGGWYIETEYQPKPANGVAYYGPHGDGFCTAFYSSSEKWCNDPMEWDADGCKGFEYLDEDEAQDDYDKEVEQWIDIVENHCVASAACNTSTSTYKYKIYSNYNASNKTLLNEFPKLAGQEDNIHGTHDELDFKKAFLTGNNAYRSTLVNPNPEKANYINTKVDDTAQHINPVDATNDSCYSQSNNNTTWYQAAWGLPGRWVSNKGGKNTYKPQDDLVNYTFEPNKYCLPKNIDDVNPNWWYWNVYEDECQNIDGSTKNEYRGTIKDWNIKAIAKNFGEFGWDIQVDCFYAAAKVQDNTTSNPTTTSTGSSCPPKGGKHPWNAYIARVINIDNPLNGGLQKKTVDTSNPDRKTGFNWTERAKNEKNEKYIVDPVKLVKKIVEETDTYSKANLEYEFELTTEKIRKLKDILKSDGYRGNFTAYNEGTTGHAGTFEHKNGIVVYSSKIVDAFGKRYATIGCNNQKPGSNFVSSECENYK